jgi:Leucine-rich repeat (LRR) protein
MKLNYKVLLTLIAFCTTTLVSAQNTIPQIERDALIAFYNSTGGPNWVSTLANNKPWDVNNPNSDVSTWYGLTIDNGHVITIGSTYTDDVFYNNNLVGTIPKEIGNLTSLICLKIIGNKLTGNIPIEIGNLINLQFLKLNGNNLTGSIPPQIGQLSKLDEISLSTNKLSGSIPVEIGQLSLLTHLSLNSNLLSGSIPIQIGLLSNLKYVTLSNNKIEGPIPNEIGNLSNLQILGLNNNLLNGTIPSQIGKLSKLTTLELFSNKLIGSIPLEICQLTELNFLNLNSNQLSGIIPSQIGQLTKLEYLFLEQNKLTGSIPLEITNLSRLKGLGLGINQLSGKIPNLTVLNLLSSFSVRANNFRFIDIANEYYNNSKLDYASQYLTDPPQTITKPIGSTVTLSMCDDNRYSADETFQWYTKGRIILGATSSQYTISNLNTSNNGLYVCQSINPKLPYLTLYRQNITLVVQNCPTVTGTIVVNPTAVTTNTSTSFSLNTTATGLTYAWTFYNDATGTIVKDATQTTATATQTYSTAGSYLVKLVVTDANNCTTTFNNTITVVDLCTSTEDQRVADISSPNEFRYGVPFFVKINETKDLFLDLNTFFKNTYTYNWRFYSPSEQLLTTGTNEKFSVTPTAGGYYRVDLEITDVVSGCKASYSKTIGCLIGNSCTELNPKSSVVKILVKNLVKSLVARSLRGETDAQINASPASPEFLALKPYLTNGIGDKIYNYNTIKRDTDSDYIYTVNFSFTPNTDYDVHIYLENTPFYDCCPDSSLQELADSLDDGIFIDLSQYATPTDYFISCNVFQAGRMAQVKGRVTPAPGECDQESEIRSINFCPIDCVPITGTLSIVTDPIVTNPGVVPVKVQNPLPVVDIAPVTMVCQQIQISGGTTGTTGSYIDCDGVTKTYTLLAKEILNSCQMAPNKAGNAILCSSIAPIGGDAPAEISRMAPKQNKNRLKK